MKSNLPAYLLSAVLMMCCMVRANAQLGTPPDDEIWYTTTDGKICELFYDKGFGANITEHKYENGRGTIKFDGSVTDITYNAFYQCSNLASIFIPGSVTAIRHGAFEECSNLTSVSIPSSVASIEYQVFKKCLNLTSVFIPNGVTSIGNGVFMQCSGLTSVSIPNSVTKIGYNPFYQCTNLRDVFFGGNSDITSGGSVFEESQPTIYVADTKNFSPTWDGRPICSWRSGKGNGAKESPYEIENYINLYGFSLEVQQGNTSLCGKLTADITANTDVLDNDGHLNSGAFIEWMPIGSWADDYAKGYRGEFDGGGHTISGLYFNNETRSAVGLFGMANGSTTDLSPTCTDRAYIHDIGVKDSYFRGKSHVGGICGDLANGRLENCWNAATVESSNDVTGGIAGSCYKYAAISSCYNIGNVSEGQEYGGICGAVYASQIADYSLSNCVSLDTKCSKAYSLSTDCPIYKISNVFIKDAAAFASGEACWILNGNQRATTWRQQLGTDNYPMMTGDLLIYYDDDNREYLNETICESTTNHLHSFVKDMMTQGGSTISYWHCTGCGKNYQFYDRANELAKTECAEPATGDGSKDNPYQIATLGNLLWFADYVNSHNAHASACAMLTADITMNASVLNGSGRLNSEDCIGWTPIGGHSVDFSGEFNGNGHTISGLYFKNTDVNNVGLFGKAAGNAHIHDLGIKDSYFYGKNHVGGICGDFASGRIENCWNGAYVMAHDYDAGGISGSCYVNASIANCYNIGIVSTYEEKGGTQDSRFGGICGSVYSTTTATYSIDNCYTLKSRSIPHDGDPYEGLPNVSGDCEKIYGMLVAGCPASKIHDSHVMKAEAFAGGEVCYRLNRGVTDGSQKWYQTLGADLSPVLNSSRGAVFYGYDGDVLKYSNTPISVGATHRNSCDATCVARGYTRECWEDTKSGKIYAEEACLNELNAAAIVSYFPSTDDPTDQINQGDVTEWTQEVNETYDGVNFGYAAVKVFKDTDGTEDNYCADEWVSFQVAEDKAQNVRLKWSWTGDKTKQSNGRYGSCDLYYKVNKGAETGIILSNASFEVSPDVYVLNLANLNKGDVVEFHIKNYHNTCKTPNEVTWAVTLEYTSKHNLQHYYSKAATCTKKGNKEYWYCTKCKAYYANAECTTVMTEWEIPALGHSAKHNAQKDATCTADGNVEHWHCTRCNLNYSDEICTSQITGSVIIPAIHHANKKLMPYKAPTADAEGNIAYWHCPDCGKNFENEGCTREIAGTDYVLARLLNVLHIDFTGNNTPIEKEHYVDATEFGFNEQGNVVFTVNGQTVTYPASMIIEMGFFNGTPAVQSQANKDPLNQSDYYTTFYSSLEAYTIPEGVKAYTATLDEEAECLHLIEIKEGFIPAQTAVVLKSASGNYKLGTCGYTEGDADNVLQGTDVQIPTPANCYILSGTAKLGVGLYPWAVGKPLAANRAYLQLTGSSSAKAFRFVFDDGEITGINFVNENENRNENENLYNLQGIRVKGGYKGIVIKNGEKSVIR
ncbi:MAG: leucine-rich repeat domain-containing protein [Bacteroidales bacterium]|nr:leucine-rich repeat domain-containing protein [Candidatus Equimonas faecalis]